jgi:N-acyl-D-amino-acid deacylase
MYDFIIRGGSIVDGLGDSPFTGDIAVSHGVIKELSTNIEGEAKEIIDAKGCIVTPGWVDIHTHYDGQVTWDEDMDPSASHGVTSVVMGNCGVGFAPVRPNNEKELIELMEGVEDIPGTALYEGMPWGAWETFPEYLEYLSTRQYAVDVAAQVPHGALRSYVMGERGSKHEDATAEDIEQMSELVEEALNAGALGFTTSRIIGHQSINGDAVPGTFAAYEELLGIAKGIKRANRGVFQIIPSSTVGSSQSLGGEAYTQDEELKLMDNISRETGCPVTFTLFQISEWPNKWKEILAGVNKANTEGSLLYPQVSGRPTGIVLSLQTYHYFMRRKAFLDIAHLPADQLIAEMRKPEVKARIIADEKVPHDLPGSMDNFLGMSEPDFGRIYPMSTQMDYEPTDDETFAALAEANGQEVFEYFYDYLLDNNGENFAIMFFSNFSDHNHDAIREMNLDPNTVSGLSDAGAHVGLIFDAVMPTYQLTHWVKGRSRGERLPLEHIVSRLSYKNAELYGLNDRGSLELGKRADINVINMDELSFGDIEIRNDLPAGGKRILQSAHGYYATMVNGVVTRRFDQDTGERPGRLIRGH